MAIKFGRKQLRNPTPSNVAIGLDIFSGVSGVVLAWVGTAPFISAANSTIIQSIMGLLIGIAQVIKPYFGVKTKIRTVDIKDVSVMDEPVKVNMAGFPNSATVPGKDDK